MEDIVKRAVTDLADKIKSDIERRKEGLALADESRAMYQAELAELETDLTHLEEALASPRRATVKTVANGTEHAHMVRYALDPIPAKKPKRTTWRVKTSDGATVDVTATRALIEYTSTGDLVFYDKGSVAARFARGRWLRIIRPKS